MERQDVSRFDRYMLSQLMALFGFFSLILVLVYWVNRAVLLFDRLIGNGQTALVFFEFTALTLPNVIRMVLPVSAFAASVYVANRLSNESELVVVQSAGMSSFRLARGALAFGVIVALSMAVLVHVLVPASRTVMAERQAEMTTNVSARFLTEGKFLHPAEGVTLFIRHITPSGELQGLFLSDARAKDSRTTYTAQRALLVKTNGHPKLLMFDGMVQRLDLQDRRLSTTTFKDFTYDISGLISGARSPTVSLHALSTWALLHPTPTRIKTTGEPASAFLYEANSRIAEPLNGLAAALLGFAAMLIGGFSRFGAWRHILFAIALLIVMQLLINAAANLAEKDTSLWILAYAAPAYGLLASGTLLWWSQRSRRRPREAGARRQRAAA